MSVATVFARRDSRVDSIPSVRHAASVAAVQSKVAFGGVGALTLLAPFETIEPVLRLPGPALSSGEAVFLAVLAS
jgi:hypothetical protein